MGFYDQDYKLAVGPANATPTLLLDVQVENVALARALDDFNGAKGTVGHFESRLRFGVKRVGGPLAINPSANELEFFLPKMMGSNPVGANYALGENPQTFSLWKVVDTRCMRYAECAIDRWTITSSRGQGFRLDMDVLCKDEDPANLAATFPAVTLGEALDDQPFTHIDSAAAGVSLVTVNGVAYDIEDLSLTLNWFVNREAFRNHATLRELRSTDRTVDWAERIPGSWETVRALTDGAAVPLAATWTNGTVSVTFSSALVRLPANTPGRPGRGEAFYPLTGRAGRTAAVTELTATLDHAP